MLRHLMHGDGYTWNPYYSEASLHVLGDWYQTQVSVAPRSAELIQKDRDNLPEWFHSDIPVEDLTAYTLWLCLDSGGYLGELFILKFPSIRWSIQKGKSTLYFNQPVIGKFIRGMTVSPFQLVTVIAYKCVDGVLASNEFLRLLEVYSELVV